MCGSCDLPSSRRRRSEALGPRLLGRRLRLATVADVADVCDGATKASILTIISWSAQGKSSAACRPSSIAPSMWQPLGLLEGLGLAPSMWQPGLTEGLGLVEVDPSGDE